MPHMIIGTVLTAAFAFLLLHTRKQHLVMAWWQWILTFLGLLYAGFVFELIVSFVEEGDQKSALVLGLILGSVAILWAVLLVRFVFKRKPKS